MTKFVVIYHADAAAVAQTEAMSPEDMQKGMQAWGQWAEGIGDALVDFGTPLMGGMKVTASTSSPSDKEVTGYSILEAESMDAVVAMLQGHPHLGWAAGCEIEVHETMAVPGM
jgi:hypothetical protein